MAIIDNCIAYYKLDGDTTDATGNGNNGTVNGATLTTGKINQGYDFDGINDKISIDLGVGNSIQSSNFSFNLWVKVDTWSGDRFPISTRDSLYDSGHGFEIDIFSNTLRYLLIGSSDVLLCDYIYTNTLDWIMLTATFDGSILKLYLNGQFICQDSGVVGTFDHRTLTLGKRETTGGTSWFDGQIDEIGVWDRTIIQSEITELYNSGNGLQYPFGVASRKAFPLFFGQGK